MIPSTKPCHDCGQPATFTTRYIGARAKMLASPTDRLRSAGWAATWLGMS